MRIKDFCMDNVAAKEKLENLLRHISADYEKIVEEINIKSFK